MKPRPSGKESTPATPASPPAEATGGLNAQVLESITQLISEAQGGRAEAWDRIYTLLYKDLHQVARSQIRQQRSFARSPTSLISETWLRLSGAKLSVNDRSHMIALIARAMRYVLLDEARRALAEKRGDGMEVLGLDEIDEPGHSSHLEQLLIIDEALNDLAAVDERLAQVVEMRYFGGLSETEIAEILQVTERTVRRDWRKARAFLFSHLDDPETGPYSLPN